MLSVSVRVMTNSADFLKRIYGLSEDEQNLTMSGFGNKRQTKSGGVTKVDVNPSTKIDAKTVDGKGFGRSYDRNNRPNDHRPGHIEQAKQPYSPSNPQSRWKDSWAKAGLETSTRAAQRRQNPYRKS